MIHFNSLRKDVLFSNLFILLLFICWSKVAGHSYLKAVKLETLMMVSISIIMIKCIVNTNDSYYEKASANGAIADFDEEAFENLNTILKSFYNKDGLTIPGNLTIDGNVKVKGDIEGDKTITVNGVSKFNKPDKNKADYQLEAKTNEIICRPKINARTAIYSNGDISIHRDKWLKTNHIGHMGGWSDNYKGSNIRMYAHLNTLNIRVHPDWNVEHKTWRGQGGVR